MIRLYMDENVHGAITRGLRQRGVDLLTAQEDGRSNTPDPQVMDRAHELGRLLFTHDPDMLAEANRRLEEGILSGGVVFAHQLAAIGICVRDLELIAGAAEPEEYVGKVEFLPLR